MPVANQCKPNRISFHTWEATYDFFSSHRACVDSSCCRYVWRPFGSCAQSFCAPSDSSPACRTCVKPPPHCFGEWTGPVIGIRTWTEGEEEAKLYGGTGKCLGIVQSFNMSYPGWDPRWYLLSFSDPWLWLSSKGKLASHAKQGAAICQLLHAAKRCPCCTKWRILLQLFTAIYSLRK